jgi:hypothetical protein
MEYRYKNPWAKSYEPQEYIRNCQPPIDHAGCKIYHVLPEQWDTVKNGVCIAQRCGLEGAKHAADLVSDMESPSFHDVWERQFNPIGDLFA